MSKNDIHPLVGTIEVRILLLSKYSRYFWISGICVPNFTKLGINNQFMLGDHLDECYQVLGYS